MWGSESSTGQDGDDTLNDHGHINDDWVTLLDVKVVLETACKLRNPLMEFLVSYRAFLNDKNRY
jgi:hypothetical protein